MSEHKIIDNRGLSCPLPVVKTKKIMDELFSGSAGGSTLVSLVDNKTAAENVSRFARNNGCEVKVEEKEEGIHVIISKTAKASPSPGDANTVENQNESQNHESPTTGCNVGVFPESSGKETVMMITTDTLGRGSEELGKLLMRSFIFTLKESQTPPEQLFFLNSGVYLTVEGSPVLEELQELETRGVKIFSCGTCIDYYQLKDKLKVGQVTNMYDSVDAMLATGRCITV